MPRGGGRRPRRRRGASRGRVSAGRSWGAGAGGRGEQGQELGAGRLRAETGPGTVEARKGPARGTEKGQLSGAQEAACGLAMRSGWRSHRHPRESQKEGGDEEPGPSALPAFARSAPGTGAEGARKELGGGRGAHRAEPGASLCRQEGAVGGSREWPLNPDVRKSGTQRCGPGPGGAGGRRDLGGARGEGPGLGLLL